ncbi:A24 family peptidase [Roseibium litorale]|uniref:Prepilin peptidase n=1 Tax=Roseibium litorale TaxID=2803841 RepID=A0ABR9CN87_9HYPH|nr:prepilin peptidase [Roseibium litorale]MBD8892326.1 prepilin peptidase [Roseibium litorale]
MLEAAVLVVFPILVAYSGCSDLFTMTIPNRVSILLISAFPLLALASGMPLSEWGTHALGGAVVFFPCLVMFSLGWMGGGDAKIASAVALWFGFGPDLLAFVLFTAIYGMVLTGGLLAFRQIPVLPNALARQDWLFRLHHPKTGIPYGIAIAAAALQVYGTTQWMELAL